MMNGGRRIVLVGDDAALGQALGEHLVAAGFAVTLAAPAEAASAALTADVVVIDGADPALCDGIRLAVELPIVALAAVPVAGADAVVAKPVRLAALVAKVEELLARRRRFAIGPWRLDAAARVIEAGGRRVRLTDKEAAILCRLRQAGGVVTRERLLAEVWGYGAAITTHTLETHIYRLRRKIEPDPASPSLLLTEPGGYRLV